MFLLPIKLDQVSFETKGRQNLQKTAEFVIESVVFCPLVSPSWISLVDPTSAMCYISMFTTRGKFSSVKLKVSNILSSLYVCMVNIIYYY